MDGEKIQGRHLKKLCSSLLLKAGRVKMDKRWQFIVIDENDLDFTHFCVGAYIDTY